ncbi:MAG: nucleotidyltransferase domain-containing protein [Clostridia bacterium]|nr:nucleotidyltransferase domain-containing protein [Clostridia bacterium]
MELKELRIEKGLTQKECANYLNVPYRTYLRYETDKDKIDTIKYKYMVQTLNQYNVIDEDKGLLNVDKIKKICSVIFADYDVEFCYLFGSYAKGTAKESSDVDLLISMPINGLIFYELVELLREKLKKKIDLLDITQLNNNPILLQEILKEGIKIYG